ncbi:hypothetical protein [Bacillus sp. REN3]|uniref:hypothetical protein n=1 Tax=Bacillus sp. REN3 TaxID=2802440 RepID=UPI001AEE2621|nr:hypothetical protein [Bacillus sp. REN3]
MDEQAISRIMKIGGVFLAAVFAGLCVPGFITGETEFMNELYEKVGTAAEIGAIAAFSLWMARIGFIQWKKRKFPYSKAIQFIFKLLNKNHVLIGWVGFAAAFAHGSYFFLQTSEESGSIYSGLAAFIAFSALVFVGMILKRSKRQRIKRIHRGIAIVFAVGLGVHLLFG